MGAGIGENPEFMRKKAARDRRRKMKKEARSARSERNCEEPWIHS